MPITLYTRFPERGHPEPYQDELAAQLNLVLNAVRVRVAALPASVYADKMEAAAVDVVQRVVEMENIGKVEL